MNINKINEARVTRTIDPKLWATMSSTSSKNKATRAVNIKPLSKELSDPNILLQKYVAGLLTIKAECPATEADINAIESYQHYGNAYLNAGGNMAAILKLYVENGGTFNGPVAKEPEVKEPEFPSYDEVETEEPETQDYPEYDEIDVPEDNSSVAVEEPTEASEKPVVISNKGFDDAVDNKQIGGYPEYDAVNVEGESFEEKYNDEALLNHYLKTVGYKLRRAEVGQYLVWDESAGLVLSDDSVNAIAKCVSSSFKNVDKKPRFMFMNVEEESLGTVGNDGEYDSYYFKKNLGNGRRRLTVEPGSNYYYQEEVKGLEYTNILSGLGNNPANAVKGLVTINNIKGVTDQLSFVLAKYLQQNAYLPTLPELVSAITELESGNYWTSTVADKGTSNVMLGVNPDKLLKKNNSSDTGKVVAFIKF